MDFDSNFFDTAAGQTIAGAHRYLSAAKILRYSPGWGLKLQTPVLHLIAHGTELLLKYPLLVAGHSPKDVANRYGHQLTDLWNANENQYVRKMAMHSANRAWNDARESGSYPDEDFSPDPKDALVRALDQLAYLHSRDSGYALRYLVEPGTLAPRPAFLIDTFGDVAERTAMNPRYVIDSFFSDGLSCDP